MAIDRDFESFAPLVAGSVAWDGDVPSAIAIDLGDRIVDLEGEQVAAVLSGCDGRTSVAELLAQHGPDARELLVALFEAGALVDGGDAWRVFHRQGSAGTALGRAASEETILELQRSRFMPSESVGEQINLAPQEATVLGLAAARESSTAEGAAGAPDFAQFSALLAAAYRIREQDNGAKRGGNPSAGALYPLVIHAVLRESIGELSPGRWWLDPFAQSLHRVGDSQGVEAVFLDEPGCDRLLERGGPLIFVSADVAAPARKYGARGYRYALIESGAAMQSVYLTATELGIPVRAIGGIDDGAAHEFLGLPESGVALLGLIVG